MVFVRNQYGGIKIEGGGGGGMVLSATFNNISVKYQLKLRAYYCENDDLQY